jgi:hypothetical protein
MFGPGALGRSLTNRGLELPTRFLQLSQGAITQSTDRIYPLAATEFCDLLSSVQRIGFGNTVLSRFLGQFGKVTRFWRGEKARFSQKITLFRRRSQTSVALTGTCGRHPATLVTSLCRTAVLFDR